MARGVRSQAHIASIVARELRLRHIAIARAGRHSAAPISAPGTESADQSASRASLSLASDWRVYMTSAAPSAIRLGPRFRFFLSRPLPASRWWCRSHKVGSRSALMSHPSRMTSRRRLFARPRGPSPPICEQVANTVIRTLKIDVQKLIAVVLVIRHNHEVLIFF